PAADPRLDQLLAAQERLERGLREEIAQAQRAQRSDLAEAALAIRTEAARSHEDLRGILARDAAAARQEHAEAQARHAARLGEQLQGLIEISERRLSEVRQTVDQRLQALQADNGAKLDEM